MSPSFPLSMLSHCPSDHNVRTFSDILTSVGGEGGGYFNHPPYSAKSKIGKCACYKFISRLSFYMVPLDMHSLAVPRRTQVPLLTDGWKDRQTDKLHPNY